MRIPSLPVRHPLLMLGLLTLYLLIVPDASATRFFTLSVNRVDDTLQYRIMTRTVTLEQAQKDFTDLAAFGVDQHIVLKFGSELTALEIAQTLTWVQKAGFTSVSVFIITPDGLVQIDGKLVSTEVLVELEEIPVEDGE